jgi:serine/threonine-protein kinase
LEGATSDEEFEAPALVGTVVADRYRVEALLGAGAMGAVFRAEHVHMQKAVALKVLHSTMSQNQEVVRRFEREAVAAARIEHPNVAAATDFGRLKDGSFYLVLEYIDGQSLGGLMEEVGAMEAQRACRIAIQIAAALAAAHAAGVVHRDLKPENVMLPHAEHPGDIVKVLDFGMAKMQASSDVRETKLTQHGAVYGTPAYMAPEQAAGHEVDHRADLYALGLMLYEMLLGKGPFQSDQVMALLVMQMTERPAPLPSSVPRQVSRLVMSLLEKKPERRPQTAEEVLNRLAEILGMPAPGPHGSALGLPAPAPITRTGVRPGSMAAIVSEQVAEQVAKVGPAIEAAVEASAPAVSFLKQPMTLKGFTFPRWVPAAGLLGFVVVLFVLMASGDDVEVQSEGATNSLGKPASQQSSAKTPADKDPDPPDAALAKVIEAASTGSDSALYALEQREDEERSLTEWMGLAQARLMRKKVEPALSAYKSAIKMDASMREDTRTLGVLRQLADSEHHAEAVLDFAAEELGPLGADLLFDVWAKTSLKTRATTHAYELLTSSKVEKNYSRALAIAMDLRDVEECQDILKLLARVENEGDERSMTRLRKMKKTDGCGKSKRDDCYPCLREGSALSDAYQAAGMRSSEHFELPRRWRFKN